ncbi:tyrosine recombinase XerC [Halorubrum sp. GN11GM_10-3_MGM]|uniref:site-specific integrase n=1 Tax=Halorubrum sp. GN11GM_10-3_MGM TaxID=2518111 RepID=UPI0010F47B38|nr:site-specific integrase [Halorubrum sp. GN11GM_10-3_MGM]TKX72370.1 site-specific integrase [Halorubrum sp. GN11GM_10-3_MGM]
MPEPQPTDADTHKPLPKAVEEWVEKKNKPGGDGNYAREADRVLITFIDWTPESVETVRDVSRRTMMRYAEYLHRRADARVADPDNKEGITGRTAQQYYALVRAFFTYCVKWGYREENPAEHKPAMEELPDASLGAESNRQQFWSPRERTAFIRYVDERAHDAISERGSDAVEETRDRALVYLFAYSGARSAELLRDPNDSRRTGITWADVDIEAGVIRVLGKSQTAGEEVQLPSQACPALERYRKILDPPTDEWPVFPTRHAPSLYKRARTKLGDRVDDLEAELEAEGPDVVLRRYEIAPPSITTETVRNIFRRLCEEGEIPVEGEHGYLKPHGARRGAGEALYRAEGSSAAQRALRHEDPSTTSKMYSHIEASEQAEVASDAFDKIDERTTTEDENG